MIQNPYENGSVTTESSIRHESMGGLKEGGPMTLEDLKGFCI